jgi:hypothetical protein
MIRKTIAFDDEMVQDLSLFARKDQRDLSSAVRYALRIGLLAIANPELTIKEIRDIMEAKVDDELGNVSELNLEDLS